jgi:hypothetical protein
MALVAKAAAAVAKPVQWQPLTKQEAFTAATCTAEGLAVCLSKQLLVLAT